MAEGTDLVVYTISIGIIFTTSFIRPENVVMVTISIFISQTILFKKVATILVMDRDEILKIEDISTAVPENVKTVVGI